MRVLVLGAGGPAGVNVCRALKAGGHEVFARDDDRDHLVWTSRHASLAQGDWLEPDVIMAQPDRKVLELATRAQETHGLGDVSAFLPSAQTILLCQDKFECGLAWRRAGLRDDKIILVETEGILVDAIAELGYPFWLRGRHGAGASMAVSARDWWEAQGWYRFWRVRRSDVCLVAEAFLPGRDYSWCGIYYDGTLQVSFARERLEYIYPNLTPEGLTGTPTRAVTISNLDVEGMADKAVRAIDQEPHGVFCVDLREDAEGVPRPTEINAGRFSTTVGLWSIYDPRSNFVALAAELAVNDFSRLAEWEDLPIGLVLNRHIDCGHVFRMALDRMPA